MKRPASETAIRHTGLRLNIIAQAVLALAVFASLLARGSPGMAPALGAVALIAASLVVTRVRDEDDLARMSVSALLMGQVMLLVGAWSGHVYQMDMHMAFFSALGLVAFLICWRSILTATLVVAIHHLALNILMPAAVFPNGADLPRVLIHAVILVVEAGALVLLAQFLARAFSDSTRALEAAEAASTEAQRLAEVTQDNQARDLERRVALDSAIASFSLLIGQSMGTAEKEITALQIAAEDLAQIAQDSSSGVDVAVSNAGDAASNVGTVASAAGELSKSIGEIAGQVQSTSETVTAVRSAGEASLQRMDELAAASERIGNVITLIQTIAAQTNLLALNATIEAARAGEAGRGFAVVASEVKTLAAQTGNATDEISTQIQAVQRATLESVNSIKAIVARMIEVDQFMSSIAAAVEEQDSTTRDMSDTMAEAARNAAMSSDGLSALKSKAEEVGRVAATVLGATDLVKGATGVMQGEVTKFIALARAG